MWNFEHIHISLWFEKRNIFSGMFFFRSLQLKEDNAENLHHKLEYWLIWKIRFVACFNVYWWFVSIKIPSVLANNKLLYTDMSVCVRVRVRWTLGEMKCYETDYLIWVSTIRITYGKLDAAAQLTVCRCIPSQIECGLQFVKQSFRLRCTLSKRNCNFALWIIYKDLIRRKYYSKRNSKLPQGYSVVSGKRSRLCFCSFMYARYNCV